MAEGGGDGLVGRVVVDERVDEAQVALDDLDVALGLLVGDAQRGEEEAAEGAGGDKGGGEGGLAEGGLDAVPEGGGDGFNFLD